MKNNKQIKRKRPLSHNPLLKFHHDDNFLYDKKFMNNEIWLQKYNLQNLREKWNQKVQTNFLQMDIKFPTTNKNPEKNKVIYHEPINKKDLYLIPNSLSFFPYLKKKEQNYENGIDKYNDKISYYLSNKNPWNNKTSIEINKDNNPKNFSVHEKIIKDLNIRKKFKNSNESKNISVKCLYYNNKYIQKKEILKELIDKYIEEVNLFVKKKYIKALKLKRHGKKYFIKIHVFKEIMKQYNELYEEISGRIKKNIFNKHILYRNNSASNIQKEKNENIKNSENIYENLFVIINYLKENKSYLISIKDNKYLIQNYFDILEKDEILKDKDLNYIKYIKNFGINNNFKREIHIIDNNKKKDLLYYRKKNGSCLNLDKPSFQKKRFSEYITTHYHPGTFYLFNEGETEFHAWSCCMNDDKKSKGCCRKTERKPFFNYDIIT